MSLRYTPDCIMPNCDDVPISHSLCNKHYYRFRNGKKKDENFSVYDLAELVANDAKQKICTINSCTEESKTRGLCRNHATRFYQLRKEGILTEPEQLQKWYDRPIEITISRGKDRERVRN